MVPESRKLTTFYHLVVSAVSASPSHGKCPRLLERLEWEAFPTVASTKVHFACIRALRSPCFPPHSHLIRTLPSPPVLVEIFLSPQYPHSYSVHPASARPGVASSSMAGAWFSSVVSRRCRTGGTHVQVFDVSTGVKRSS